MIRFFISFIFFCSSLCPSNDAYAASSEKPVFDPLCLYLTWQKNPESTMTISWITETDQKENRVFYRKIGQEKWDSASGSHRLLPEDVPYLLHRIELKDLTPDTAYEFRTGQDAKIYKFKTMPATLFRSIRFVAGGDMYHDTLEILRETNVQAALSSPSFALVGGDIAYASDKFSDFLPRWTHPLLDRWTRQKFDRWLAWLIAWKEDMVTPDGYLIPMIPAIGNHDTIGRFGQTPEQAPFFYALFPMPGLPGYNALDFGNYLSFFILDSGHTNPISGKQAEWLAQALKQRKNVTHKFALYHVPAYPCVDRLEKAIGTEIRKHWVPSFDAWHLTAAFENHEHAYKRTHPLINGKIHEQGVLYLGDGSWGVQKPRTPRRVHEKLYLAKTASARHFLVIDLDDQKRTVYAVNFDGALIDSFSW